METLEYRFVDKTGWGEGPWNDEPDKLQWPDKATELPCLIVRNHGGALCGYVGIDKDHPLSGAEYEEPDVEVHGGLTYADYCVEDNKEHGICHVAAPGEPEPLYWLGFDCGHAFDLHPVMEMRHRDLAAEAQKRIDDGTSEDVSGDRELVRIFSKDYGETYKDIDYVKEECANLARQLAALG